METIGARDHVGDGTMLGISVEEGEEDVMKKKDHHHVTVFYVLVI